MLKEGPQRISRGTDRKEDLSGGKTVFSWKRVRTESSGIQGLGDMSKSDEENILNPSSGYREDVLREEGRIEGENQRESLLKVKRPKERNLGVYSGVGDSLGSFLGDRGVNALKNSEL